MTDNMVLDMSTTERFEKDTLYSWNGDVTAALKFESVVNYRTFYRFTPFLEKSDYHGHGYVLFAKDVGLVYYKSEIIFSESTSFNYEVTLLALEVSEPDQSIH